MSQLRAGYVGIEHHHRDPYLQIIRELPVTIKAICEPGRLIQDDDLEPQRERPDEIRAADRSVTNMITEVDRFTDPAEMVSQVDLDLLWITYSNDQTPEIISQALEYGLSVISEKPLARHANELETLCDQISGDDSVVIPSYFYRANPVVRDLQR